MVGGDGRGVDRAATDDWVVRPMACYQGGWSGGSYFDVRSRPFLMFDDEINEHLSCKHVCDTMSTSDGGLPEDLIGRRPASWL